MIQYHFVLFLFCTQGSLNPTKRMSEVYSLTLYHFWKIAQLIFLSPLLLSMIKTYVQLWSQELRQREASRDNISIFFIKRWYSLLWIRNLTKGWIPWIPPSFDPAPWSQTRRKEKYQSREGWLKQLFNTGPTDWQSSPVKVWANTILTESSP